MHSNHPRAPRLPPWQRVRRRHRGPYTARLVIPTDVRLAHQQ